MIAVMGAAMVMQSALVSAGGAALLVAVLMVCAGLSRGRLVARTRDRPVGDGAHVARVALVAATRAREWRMPAASAAVTLAGLALMPALCG